METVIPAVTESRQRFRQYLCGDKIVYPISVFDPISARIAQYLGVPIGILGGSIASAHILAAPDIIVLTLTELADQVRRITRAADVNLMVDADHGYGNAMNTIRTVEELETAGAAAITIEDTLLPTEFGNPKPRLVSSREMVGKLKSAVSGKKDPNMVIVARTSSLEHDPIEQTIRRVIEYSRTGVDALMLVGSTDRSHIARINEATDLPLVLGNPDMSLMDERFLLSSGVRIVLRGHQPFSVALKSLYEAMKYIHDGGNPSHLGDQTDSKDLENTILKTAQYAEWQRQYLK